MLSCFILDWEFQKAKQKKDFLGNRQIRNYNLHGHISKIKLGFIFICLLQYLFGLEIAMWFVFDWEFQMAEQKEDLGCRQIRKLYGHICKTKQVSVFDYLLIEYINNFRSFTFFHHFLQRLQLPSGSFPHLDNSTQNYINAVVTENTKKGNKDQCHFQF